MPSPKTASKHCEDRRERLPNERGSFVHEFNISGFEGRIVVSTYADGRPAELFLKSSTHGSTLSGLMDSFATMVSMALQYGAPLEALADKMIGKNFEPHGYTRNLEIERCASIVDYVFRVLMARFHPEQPTT